MTDRETVIKELENYEPYARVFSNITITGSVVLDALALLKEQEHKLVCPKCNGQPKYVTCGLCGQVVKLND